MSAKSLKELPRSSDCSGVPQIRSISDIIQSLKAAFRDSDYSAAARDLKAREESVRRERNEVVASLREKCDALETDLGGLRTEKCSLEVERSRLERECDVLNDKLNESTREFSLVKEKEVRAEKRYGDLLYAFTKMGEDKVRETGELSNKLEEAKRKLAEKEVAIDDYERRVSDLNAQLEDTEEVWRKNERLEEEKRKHAAQLEEIKREKDGKIKELLDTKKLIEAELEAQKEELGNHTRKSAVLEEQKAKLDIQVVELQRYNREKDEKIRKLEKEKNDAVKEKEELVNVEANSRVLEERFSKLESDVVTCMTLDLERKEGFASTRVGKILSKIIQALDSEEVGVTCNAGMEKVDNTPEADSNSVSRVSKSKFCLISDKNSTEYVKRTLFVKEEPESPSEDETTGSKKADVIFIDSDDEDEKPLRISGVINKRKFPGGEHDQHNNDSSYDNSGNPKHKNKKLEQVKQESSLGLSAAKDDSKLTTTQKKFLAGIRKCGENLRKVVSGSGYSFLEDDNMKSNDSKYRDGFSKPDKVSPQVQSYITTHRQRKQNKKLECAADMICAFDQDYDLCAKAVCALYRHLKSRSSGPIGSDLGESTKVQECDLERLVALAEFLIDGDFRDKMKKSVGDLRQHDQNGLNDCRRFAKTHCKTLIDIYKKGEDPLFSPLSSDLQYT